ncbi:MAG: phage tail tube protein [Vicinamibacterales bacterium]
MASANRTQILSVKETTLGTTPSAPRMRTRTATGESLALGPMFVETEEMRSDAMVNDPIRVGQQNGGGLNYEFNYPYPNSPGSTDIESALHNAWTDTNSRDNDGTADSVITDVATTNTVLTVTTGTAFAVGQLVRWTGFGVATNLGVFAVTTGSATVPRFVGSGITNETAPPAAARVKVVGFIGASGDITATATGLGSTTLDFTTLGLTVGQWVKIGGTGSGNRYATEALNSFARITAIAVGALTMDNLPTGWTTDSGTGKTIKVWVSDYNKNGTTQIGQTIERGFLGQTVPTYVIHTGMLVSSYQMSIAARDKVKLTLNYSGMSGSQSTTALDASPDASLAFATYPVFAGSAHVGRIGEGGSTISSPNWVQSLTFTLSTLITPILSADSQAAVGQTSHARAVAGEMSAYFGDNSLITKFYAGTPTAFVAVLTRVPQAFVVDLPRVTYTGGGGINASARNQDVMQTFQWMASKDETVTNAMITFSRFEYYEA